MGPRSFHCCVDSKRILRPCLARFLPWKCTQRNWAWLTFWNGKGVPILCNKRWNCVTHLRTSTAGFVEFSSPQHSDGRGPTNCRNKAVYDQYKEQKRSRDNESKTVVVVLVLERMRSAGHHTDAQPYCNRTTVPHYQIRTVTVESACFSSKSVLLALLPDCHSQCFFR
jgi:hypothetical protein